MNINFLQLKKIEQQQLLINAERKLGISALIIEKDIWVCWLLSQLFSLPMQMAFKGGTSLSKVYNLIQRFSEDIDITIDYTNITSNLDISNTSKSQLKKISDQLKKELLNITKNTILPFLEKQTKELFPDHNIKTTLSDNGEQLEFYYPSALEDGNTYMRDHVLLEFGIRNSTEPCEKHKINPLLLKTTDIIKPLPGAINVLSPARTFWEKATLIHVECHRKRLTNTPDRLSRHWYDLAKLANSKIGKKALREKNIFLSVLEHKKAFYNASYASYDNCLSGKFLLVPDPDELNGLEKDYQQMRLANYFWAEPPKFSEIIDTLSKLEKNINTTKYTD